VPGILSPMNLETDALAYIDPRLPLYEDTRHFEESISGLSALQVWVQADEGSVIQPNLLRGLERFSQDLEADPRVGSVVGPTTLRRWMRYVPGQGDRLPDDPGAWPALSGQLDQVLLEEPAARGYVDVATLGSARLTMIYRDSGFAGVDEIRRFVKERWDRRA